ncbi:SCNM1 protein, partial [Loxia curvirostra]|nr:SCNM1 protein [Loxia curvirostra]
DSLVPGGDRGWPCCPQRRRVAELLASAIPEDEALLLRDGRVACSLCPQRPVCDTLQTLLLHRAGRKHLDRVWAWPGWAWPEVGVSPQAPLLARTRRLARSALLRAAPYSSCCRRAPTGRGEGEEIPKAPRGRARARSGCVPCGTTCTCAGELGSGNSGENPENTPPKIPTNIPEMPRGIPKAPLGPRRGPNTLSLCPSRGWLQDPAGNWVKDGNAEFDSDEEEPPPLPPA